MKKVAALVFGLVMGTFAVAAPVTGSAVNISLQQGIQTSITPGGGCRNLAATGRVIGSGIELTDADFVSGGCSGGMSVDIDGDAHTITLRSTGGAGDYRWATLDITGFGSLITGLSLVSNNLFFGDIPVPVLSFTSSSLSMSFDPPGDGVFDMEPAVGVTVFSFTVADASAVPEPGSLALLGLGLVGLVASRKRKQA